MSINRKKKRDVTDTNVFTKALKASIDNKSNCIFPSVHKHLQIWFWGQPSDFSALWICWKTCRATFWIFNLLPLKRTLAALGVLRVSFPAAPPALALWVWLVWLQPSCLPSQRPSNRHCAEMLGSYEELHNSSTTEISKQSACRWNAGLQAQK